MIHTLKFSWVFTHVVVTSWFFVCFAAILTKIIAHRKQIESVVDIEMQCDMLFILSALCESDVHRKVAKSYHQPYSSYH